MAKDESGSKLDMNNMQVVKYPDYLIPKSSFGKKEQIHMPDHQ